MSCPPRYGTARTPSRRTFGGALDKIATLCGLPLMGWQRQVADVGLEVLPDGRFAYREIVCTVPRQSAKSTLALWWVLHRLMTEQRADCVYGAQDGTAARSKLVNDWWPIVEPHQQTLGIRRLLRANGAEKIEMLNGSRVTPMSSAPDAVHGRTISLGVVDEFFADTDNRRFQALIPAMSTVANAQLLVLSTAGTDESGPLNEAVARGRREVLAGGNSGTAYFEWSADSDDDPDDPATWRKCMPALGISQPEDAIRHARNSMPDYEFRRAFLNQPTSTAPSAMIDPETWAAVQSPNAVPKDPLVLAVDVNVDRDGAAIVAWSESERVIEVVDHRQGLDWVPDRLVELHARHKPTITCDGSPRAPIAGLLPEIQRRGVPIKPMKASEYPGACARFYDAILAKDLKVRPHPALSAAISGAQRRSSGDGFTFSRKGRADISPLVAAAIAAWTQPHAPKRTYIYR